MALCLHNKLVWLHIIVLQWICIALCTFAYSSSCSVYSLYLNYTARNLVMQSFDDVPQQQGSNGE